MNRRMTTIHFSSPCFGDSFQATLSLKVASMKRINNYHYCLHLFATHHQARNGLTRLSWFRWQWCQWIIKDELQPAIPQRGSVVDGVTVAPVAVSNGLFTSSGLRRQPFMGAPRWQISLNLFGTDMVPTTLLQPRRQSTAPYALHAANAANLMTSSMPWTSGQRQRVLGWRALHSASQHHGGARCLPGGGCVH
jgi:hypothetical protein